MSKHTSEPWLAFIDCCEPATAHPESDGVVRLGFEDYQRARACVNACRGLATEGLEGTSLLSLLSSLELKRRHDELISTVKELEFLASKASNVAYNLGQSHKQWPAISETLDELHAVRMKAMGLCRQHGG